MSAPSTSGLSVELLLRIIDVKYGCFTLLYFTFKRKERELNRKRADKSKNKIVSTLLGYIYLSVRENKQRILKFKTVGSNVDYVTESLDC